MSCCHIAGSPHARLPDRHARRQDGFAGRLRLFGPCGLNLMRPAIGTSPASTFDATTRDLAVPDALVWDVSPVPEPSTLGLVELGLLVTSGAASRRRTGSSKQRLPNPTRHR